MIKAGKKKNQQNKTLKSVLTIKLGHDVVNNTLLGVRVLDGRVVVRGEVTLQDKQHH